MDYDQYIEACALGVCDILKESVDDHSKLSPINLQELKEQFDLTDSDFWKQYIIDLEQPNAEVYKKGHPFYLHTPRIYQLKRKGAVDYFIEKIISVNPDQLDCSEEINQAVAFCKQQGIHPDEETACVIVEKGLKMNTIKVKFKTFQSMI